MKHRDGLTFPLAVELNLLRPEGARGSGDGQEYTERDLGVL